MAGSATCSGEGGILPEEMAAADKYIFEYVPNRYSATPENLRNADAIEIKIGQGTKPGMAATCPGGKVTEEIARIRQKPLGQDVISPSKFPEVNTREDLRALVDFLRAASDGRPIGIKIAAGASSVTWSSASSPGRTSSPSTGAAGRRARAPSSCVTRPACRLSTPFPARAGISTV